MEFINTVIAFFNRIIDFINQGIYDFVVQAYAQFIIWYTIATLKAKILLVGFAWDIAQEILAQLNVSSQLNAAFAALDSDVLSAINFFGVPEAVSILLGAATTRFVLRFMGQG